MRSQIFILPLDLLDNFDPYIPYSDAGGMIYGMIINCDTDEELMMRLESVSDLGLYSEIKLLEDNQPWPSSDERRKEFIEGI